MMSDSLESRKLLRTNDIARRFGISDRAVRKWISAGLGGRKLRAKRAAGTGMWFVEEADLEAFLTSNETPNTIKGTG